MRVIIFLLLIFFINKVYYSNNNINMNIDKFIIYKKYNSEIYEKCYEKIKYIEKLIIIMRNKKLRQSKQIYENILYLGKECVNSFHSLIYSIPPDVQNLKLENNFNKDLRLFKLFIDNKIKIAKNIYIEKKKNANCNLYDDLLHDNLPLPFDNKTNYNNDFY